MAIIVLIRRPSVDFRLLCGRQIAGKAVAPRAIVCGCRMARTPQRGVPTGCREVFVMGYESMRHAQVGRVAPRPKPYATYGAARH